MPKAEATSERDRTSAPPPGPRRLRKWMFRLAAMLLAPALVLGITEGALRLFGYGYPTDFFRTIPGQDAYTGNPRFGWRFFPRALSHAPTPFRLAADKPEGTYRIFVLGGSAARGWPEPGYSFSRILEVMLREQFPHARFEVVNAAMPAINSHVVLPIARDCAEHDGDLFIVYMGNNEIIGPFGAGTVFGGYSPSLPLIHASLWLRTTKVGQLIQNLLASPGGESEEWRDMMTSGHQRLAAADARLDRVVDHFRTNLTDICATARGAGATTIVCTVASNLKDYSPLISLHRADLDAAQKERWEKAYDAGVTFEEAGEHDRAVQQYLAAAAIDDQFADLHFRIGWCDLAGTRPAEAHRRFLLARDLDAARFRTDSRLNTVIREVAAVRSREGVVFVDAERRLAECERTPEGIPGKELFYDHVHMTFEGDYELARAVFEAAVRQLPEAIRSRAGGAVQPPSRDRCAELLALTQQDRHRMEMQARKTMRHLPFTNRPDPAPPQEKISQEPQPVVLYRQALERNPDDLHVRRNLAIRLFERGEHAASVEQWRALLERIPQDGEAKVGLGTALLGLGRMDDAMAAFREGIDLSGEPELLGNRIGVVLLANGKVDEAIARFRAAMRNAPDVAEIRGNLGMALFAKQRYDEAVAEFSEAVRLHGEDPRARGNLGATLIQVGRIDDAIPHLLEAVRIDSHHPTAYEHLAEGMAHKGRREEAAQYLDVAERLAPNLPEVRREFTEMRWRLKLRPRAPETQPDPARTPR